MPQQRSDLEHDYAATFSPPPCGEGLGVGVAGCGPSVPHGTTPHPNPPPQGGRESPAAPSHSHLAVRALRLLAVLAMGTMLAACGRCGDFLPSGQSQIGACHSDSPPPR
jgi:hypothetical protein